MRRVPCTVLVPLAALALPAAAACSKQPSEPAPVLAEAGQVPHVPAAPPLDANPADAAASGGGADASAASPRETADAAGTSRAADAGSDASGPAVKIVTIGMHVGGGPYDEPTKEPIKKSVEPHFRELARCWSLVTKPRQADIGVDLIIEANGGRAKVSNPRTSVEGEGFAPCVVSFFEGIEFLPPKFGRTVVSYSVRFLP